MSKRIVSRFAWNLPCYLEYRAWLYKAKIINLSLNGLLIEAVIPGYREDDDGVIIIIGGKKIDCRVVRKEKNLIGLQYEYMDIDTLLTIKEKLIEFSGDKDLVEEEFTLLLEGGENV